jgi:hypothetical protein
MIEHLTGSWKSESSNIPKYIPGREWLHFSADGMHVMEALHPGQDTKSVKTEFTTQHQEGAYRFCPTKSKPDGSVQICWRVSIVRVSEDEIAVTPDLPKHGFTTVYRRVMMKKEANQAPQRNAGIRPSSVDSSASETPSSLGPRG